MVEDDRDVLRSVAWSELFPWLNIFRTFRLAISLRVLVMAALAAFLTLLGWAVLGQLFSADGSTGSSGAMISPQEPLDAIDAAVPDHPPLLDAVGAGVPYQPDAQTPAAVRSIFLDPLLGSWAMLSQPLWRVFHPRLTVPGLFCTLLSGLWALAVWAFFGSAITRIASVELAAGERVGWVAAVRHAAVKWPSCFFAPLMPVFGVLLAAFPVWLCGLLLTFNVGVLIAAILWPLVLAAGLAMAVLLLGLIFGWPLMFPTIGTEGTDAFDALSRSYAYVFQRPLHYLFYAVVAGLFGLAGWLLVQNFAAGVIGLGHWATGWAPGEQLVGGPAELTGVGAFGSALIGFWDGVVKLLAVGFLFGYFWTAMTAVYFLLRRNVDDIEMDEVFLEEDSTEPPDEPPPIQTDESGAPVV